MNAMTLALAALVFASLSGCASNGTAQERRAAEEAGVPMTEEARINAQKDDADPEKVVCKRITKTGTRFTEKVCATNRDWADSQKGGKKTTRELQRRPQQGRDAG